MSADIEIFTEPNCLHCEGAKTLLIENGVTFVERRVDDSEELAELRRRLPRSTSIPQIFVDGVHIGNDDDLRIRHSGGRTPFGS